MTGFLTPDTIPASFILRALRIPHGVEWMGLIGGLLSAAAYTNEWELYGSITPEDAAYVVKDILASYYEGSGMIGSIIPYASASPPSMMLPCDGSEYARSDYPQLYSVLDSALIVDADTFTTPDLRSRTIIGAGEGLGLSYRPAHDTGGEETHALTVSEMPEHDHTADPHRHTINQSYPYNGVVVPGSVDMAAGESVIPVNETNDATVTLQTKGDSQPHNNMQPYYALNYGIVFV